MRIFQRCFLAVLLYGNFLNATSPLARESLCPQQAPSVARKVEPPPSRIALYRITDPETGQKGSVLGSCHILSLKWVLSQLPAAALDVMNDSKNVFVEACRGGCLEEPLMPKTEVGAHAQPYWDTNPQKARVLRKLLENLGEKEIEPYFAAPAPLLERMCARHFNPRLFAVFSKFVPPYESGRMDAELVERCKEEGRFVYELDDFKSRAVAFESTFLDQETALDCVSTKIVQDLVLAHLYQEIYLSQGQKSLHRKWHGKRERESLIARIKRLQQKFYDSVEPLDKDKEMGFVDWNDLIAYIALRKDIEQVRKLYRQNKFLSTQSLSAKITRDHLWDEKIKDAIKAKENPLFVFGAAHLGTVLPRFESLGYTLEYMETDGKWEPCSFESFSTI